MVAQVHKLDLFMRTVKCGTGSNWSFQRNRRQMSERVLDELEFIQNFGCRVVAGVAFGSDEDMGQGFRSREGG